MRRFLTVALIIGGMTFAIHCKAYCPTPLHEVQNRYTAKGDGLKGNVFSVKTYDVDFKLEFGEYIKGDMKHEHIVYYDENGYRLGESKTYSHKKYLITGDSIFIGIFHSVEDFEDALFSEKLPDYECRDAVREYMEYDEKGRLISIIRDHDWRKTKQTFEYTPTGYKGKYFSSSDADPNFYEMKNNVFTPNVKYRYSSISYYNKDGYLERYNGSDYNRTYNHSGIYDYYDYYKYNVYGHLVESGRNRGRGNKTEYVYKYEYDDQGNWISRKKFDCDETIDGKYKMEDWQMREIVYKTPEENVTYRKEYVREKVIVEEIKKPEPKPEPEKIFTAVEQKAQYPGGEAELLKWISSNIQYPTMAQEEGIQGRVVVQFVEEKDGSISQVKVARGIHQLLDKEAVRVVKSIKEKFVPAKQNGNTVRSWFTLPVIFNSKKSTKWES